MPAGFTTLIVLLRFSVAWVYTLLCCVACVAIALLGMPRQAWLIVCPLWARGVMRIIGVRVRIHGAQNLVGPALFVSNHQSLFDLVFLPAILPRQIKWIAKKEIARVPFFGWAFGTGGAIFIDRKNPMRAVDSIREGLTHLPDGWSVVVFPEGTRTRDGRLLPFKKGVFHIAMQSRLPVVPIGVFGAHGIIRPRGSVARAGFIEITVGARISTDQWETSEVDARMLELRRGVEAGVEASRLRYLAERPDPMLGASDQGSDHRWGLPGAA